MQRYNTVESLIPDKTGELVYYDIVIDEHKKRFENIEAEIFNYTIDKNTVISIDIVVKILKKYSYIFEE